MKTSLRILLSLSVAALVACGGSDNPQPPQDLKQLAVTVAPGDVSVPTGGTAQFSASVTNSKKGTTTVSWSVKEANGGTITATGVYTAPLAAGTFHVVATSDDDHATQATAAVTVTAVGVTVSPDSPTLPTGGAEAFTASVSGSSNTAVTWSVLESGGGTINSSGYYTAPETGGTYHVTATSVADESKKATVAITVQNVVVSVSPESTELDQGASQTFNADVAATANDAVVWSVQEANGGSISSTGVYTAPAAAGTYHVVATSVVDATKTRVATISVHPVGIRISPTSVQLEAGQLQPFTVTVTGTVNQSATWTVQEANGGSVDASGSYIAPSAIGTYHVVATSAADGTQQATASVEVPQAQGFTYTDPTSTGWRLVKNAASTSSHLVLDLVGPSGVTGKGVAFTLTTDPQSAKWSKVDSGDSEYLQNIAFSLTDSPALFKGTAKHGSLVAGVFQKGGNAVDLGAPLASVALDTTSAVLPSGTSVPVGVAKAEALDASGALAPISVAVGTLKAH